MSTLFSGFCHPQQLSHLVNNDVSSATFQRKSSPLSILCFLILFCATKTEITTTFTLLPSTLPQNTKWPIGGYCNITQRIWLFGGTGNDKRVISFDPIHYNVTQHADSNNIFPIYNRGGILDGIFYFNSPASRDISRFFTSDASFDYKFTSHSERYTDFHVIPTMIASDSVLFVLGDSTAKQMYIVDIASLQWTQCMDYTQHTPPITIGSHLYLVTSFIIEYIDISGSIADITSRNWQQTAVDLQYRTAGATAFYNRYSDSYQLWMWGGYAPGSYQQEGVRIFDTETLVVEAVTTGMAFADALAVYVEFQDMWYVLGGHWGYNVNRIYSVEYTMRTAAPSNPPTQPTAKPTQSPTKVTAEPTMAPSMSPTAPPTNPPTKAPSIAPSMSPTAAPSASPTAPPTNAPSQEPTKPSSAPTKHPTLAPTIPRTHADGAHVPIISTMHTADDHTVTVALITRGLSTGQWMTILVGILAVAVVIVCIAVLVIEYKKKQMRHKKRVIEMEQQQNIAIESQPEAVSPRTAPAPGSENDIVQGEKDDDDDDTQLNTMCGEMAFRADHEEVEEYDASDDTDDTDDTNDDLYEPVDEVVTPGMNIE